MSALLIAGWATVRAAELAEHLAGRQDAGPARLPEGQWGVADPVGPDDPIGRPQRMVVVRARPGTEPVVEFVPGSQGEQDPPPADVEPMRSRLSGDVVLVLDARCWLRVPAGTADVTVWSPA
jgi:hypothetical protein